MSANVHFGRRRRVVGGACLLSLVVVAWLSPHPTAAACWVPPVVAPVTDPYREPPCRWCAGNRGIEYRLAGNVAIRAAASGRVVFSGTVVGVHYVVIRLANGWRHTYGHLISTSIDVGDAVLAGRDIGRASDIFFFGLRISEDYRDPAPFIGVEWRRPRLVPLDGTPPRPAPPPRLRCPHLGTRR
jgi:hypothetical protein